MTPELPDAETAELFRLASTVVERVEPGEQLEAFVAASAYTTVRVHGGEVEEFTSASGRGIGVRVVRDHRQGFAWAGTFEPDALAETLAEARDNARYAEPEDWVGLAEPDGVVAVPHERFDPAVAALAADDKVARALELERMVRAGDPRITGVRTASYGDSVGQSARRSGGGVRGRRRRRPVDGHLAADTQSGHLRMGTDPRRRSDDRTGRRRHAVINVR